MKLKRILAGVTACTIVGSTMLAMPASATTTTAAKDVKIFDVMNAAKTIAEMDVSDDVKSTLLDKFDTNGNGKIDMTELIAMAQRVAKLNDQDIVNEYGTADETTTTEETTGETTVETTVSTDETTETTLETTVSTDETTETTVETSETSEETTETTLETTETTEETTTTTAALEPTVAIGDNEYEDGDTVVVEEGTDVYSVSVSDENYDVEVALEGSKDADGKDAVRVNGTNFVCNSDGKLTITVTVPGTDLKEVITLNVKTVKPLKSGLYLGYVSGNGNSYSDEYKTFAEEMKADVAEGKQGNAYVDPTDTEDYWETKQGHADKFVYLKDDKESVEAGKIEVAEGGAAAVIGFFEDEAGKTAYDTTDTVTYLSLNESVATVDEDGVITAVGKSGEHTSILVMVNGKKVSTFDVYVTEGDKTAIVEADTVYVKNAKGYTVDGKYITEASTGRANSLASLRTSAGGAENVKSFTLKNADGSKLTSFDVYDFENVLYFADADTNTVYYAITSEEGVGSITVNGVKVTVLDMEQFKANRVIPTGTIKFEMNGVKATSKTPAGKPVYVTEGTTFTLSDIVKVEGVTNPTVTVENSDTNADTQNVSYDALTKTFTVNELTDKNSGNDEDGNDKNAEIITFSYKVSNTDTRTVKVEFITVKPALKVTKAYGITDNDIDINGGTYYVAKDEIAANDPNNVTPVYVKAVDEDGNIKLDDVKTDEYKVTSSDEKKVTVGTDGKTLAIAKDYAKTAKAGDTVTITYTFEQGQTVSYTIEVVDDMPTVAKNSMVEDTFEYTDKTGTGYQANVKFAGLVKASNIPDGAELVVNVVKDGTSNNVTFMNGTTQENKTGYTVSAVDIALESAGNNSYTLTGIEVGAKDKVAENTTIAFEVSVVDADGNVLTKPEKIVVTINPATTPEAPTAPAAKTFEAATLTDGNTTATYTIADGDLDANWAVDTANRVATTESSDVESIEVKNGTITLKLKDAYINTTEKTVTVKVPVKATNGSNAEGTWEVTLAYKAQATAPVTTPEAPAAQEFKATLNEDNKTATYTFNLVDWVVDTDKEITLPAGVESVEIKGNTITLKLASEYTESGEGTVDVTIPLKVADETKYVSNTQNWEITLKYTAYVAPTPGV